MSKTKSIKNIKEANEEMLRYFNALYSEHHDELQSAKSRLFEINVKLDELVKTKNIYSLFNTQIAVYQYVFVNLLDPEIYHHLNGSYV